MWLITKKLLIIIKEKIMNAKVAGWAWAINRNKESKGPTLDS